MGSACRLRIRIPIRVTQKLQIQIRTTATHKLFHERSLLQQTQTFCPEKENQFSLKSQCSSYVNIFYEGKVRGAREDVNNSRLEGSTGQNIKHVQYLQIKFRKLCPQRFWHAKKLFFFTPFIRVRVVCGIVGNE